MLATIRVKGRDPLRKLLRWVFRVEERGLERARFCGLLREEERRSLR